jgi:DNA-binding ferritin-like protein
MLRDVAGALNISLADVFGLYLKTKNFHWHVSAPFRDYRLIADEQGGQIFAATGAIAERVRKIGGATLRSSVGKSPTGRGHSAEAQIFLWAALPMDEAG